MKDGALMDPQNALVAVVGAGPDGCWLSAFVESEQAKRMDEALRDGEYFVADREFGNPDAVVRCQRCRLVVCIGHLVRRYTLRISRGRNLYVDMRAYECPRCHAHIPVTPLPLSAD